VLNFQQLDSYLSPSTLPVFKHIFFDFPSSTKISRFEKYFSSSTKNLPISSNLTSFFRTSRGSPFFFQRLALISKAKWGEELFWSQTPCRGSILDPANCWYYELCVWWFINCFYFSADGPDDNGWLNFNYILFHKGILF